MVSEARKRAQIKYNHSTRGKLVNKKYKQSEKGKLTTKKWQQENKEHLNAYLRQRWKSGEGKITTKNWRKSNKERYAETKSKSMAKRNRNLGFNKLVENDWNCKIDWHHVNDNDVVPVPRNLHQMCPSNNSKEHRKICNKLVNILYEGELKV